MTNPLSAIPIAPIGATSLSAAVPIPLLKELVSSSTPQFVFSQPEHDFDKEILIPLRQKQLEEAQKQAAALKDCTDQGGTMQDDQCVLPPPEPVYEPIQADVAPVVTYSQTGNSANAYDFGQCTWYVKTRRPDIGSYWGNANQWIYGAQASGYSIGGLPRVGAIGVANWGNHVVYIENVSGDQVYVSEMNYFGNGGGWDIISYRWTSASEFSYIY